MTYHPVTLETEISAEQQIKNLFRAIKAFDFQMVVTAPNVDVGREKINEFIEKRARQSSDIVYLNSLGSDNYLNLVGFCEFVIGNSSSGVIEVPFFRIPTVNIGDRQKGRLRHASVIDTDYSVQSIKKGILQAINPEFRSEISKMQYQFGDGNTADKMIEILKVNVISEPFMQKKLDFPY